MDSINTDFCPRFHHAIELIGRRWTGVILRELLRGRTRFNDLAASIPGMSDAVLSDRLKELEAEGLIERRVYPETPVRIEYTPTAKGRALELVFGDLATWAETWVVPAQPVPR